MQGMQLPVCFQRLDGGDLRAVGLNREQGAGLDGGAVQQHGAGAAEAGVTTDMRAGQTQFLADEFHQQLPGFHVPLAGFTIHGNVNGYGL